MWYIHTMEYFPSIKRNELLSHIKTLINLKYILLSERSQSEILHTVLFQLYDIMETIRTVKRSVVTRDSWGGTEGRIYGAHGILGQ